MHLRACHSHCLLFRLTCVWLCASGCVQHGHGNSSKIWTLKMCTWLNSECTKRRSTKQWDFCFNGKKLAIFYYIFSTELSTLYAVMKMVKNSNIHARQRWAVWFNVHEKSVRLRSIVVVRRLIQRNANKNGQTGETKNRELLQSIGCSAKKRNNFQLVHKFPFGSNDETLLASRRCDQNFEICHFSFALFRRARRLNMHAKVSVGSPLNGSTSNDHKIISGCEKKQRRNNKWQKKNLLTALCLFYSFLLVIDGQSLDAKYNNFNIVCECHTRNQSILFRYRSFVFLSLSASFIAKWKDDPITVLSESNYQWNCEQIDTFDRFIALEFTVSFIHFHISPLRFWYFFVCLSMMSNETKPKIQ